MKPEKRERPPKKQRKQISSIYKYNLESPENVVPLQLITLDSSHLISTQSGLHNTTHSLSVSISLPRSVYLLCAFFFYFFYFLQEGPIAIA